MGLRLHSRRLSPIKLVASVVQARGCIVPAGRESGRARSGRSGQALAYEALIPLVKPLRVRPQAGARVLVSESTVVAGVSGVGHGNPASAT